MKDGLSQEDRQKGIETERNLTLIDTGMKSLLTQVEKLAGLIRYYNADNHFDGYFDQFLDEIKEIITTGQVKFDKKREPAQALLYTFLHHLHQQGITFNERWHNLSAWYLNTVLQVKDETLHPDYTYIAFKKNTTDKIRIRRGTEFTWDKSDPNEVINYHSQETFRLSNVLIDCLYSFYFGKNPNFFSTDTLDIPSFFKFKDLFEIRNKHNMLFNANEKAEKCPLGLCISSPSLLLREGKRNVSFIFTAGKYNRTLFFRHIISLVKYKQSVSARKISRKNAKELVLLAILKDVFYLEISVKNGWMVVSNPVVSITGSGLKIMFQLNESFPATEACVNEIHNAETPFPCLKIFLNWNAWVFPYVWLKDFMIDSIQIETQVEGINNILFYNELGQVDISAPFAPFGINTEKGSSFTIGSYEMAVKKVSSADLTIDWLHLPENQDGLSGYYSEYENNTDNLSFRIQPRYLNDYKWLKTKETEDFFLFSTEVKNQAWQPLPQSELSSRVHLKDICMEDSLPVMIEESDYQYSTASKNGFLNLTLVSPEMGFGEKRYRQLFAERMVKKSLKKKELPVLNLPISPLVEHVRLAYKAKTSINLNSFSDKEHTILYHIYPQGFKQLYPLKKTYAVPFCYSLDSDANIMLALKNVEGNEFLNLYFVMHPQKCEVETDSLPLLSFSWGDGYRWEKLPDESIQKNTTNNLVTSGLIKIFIPEVTNQTLYDAAGRIWLRIAVLENEQYISGIENIHTNVIKVLRNNSQLDIIRSSDYVINTAESQLSGVSQISQITPFSDIRQKETNRKKLLRVSEYITHRGRAVTSRDFERMALQAFPEIWKIKCFPNTSKQVEGFKCAGVVTLAVVPHGSDFKEVMKPLASPELLLDIEKYFAERISPSVQCVDAVNPVYEEIVVRCEVDMEKINNAYETARVNLNRQINHLITPWRKSGNPPVFGFTISYKEMFDKISKMPHVTKLHKLSILQIIKEEDSYRIEEYTAEAGDSIVPSTPFGIFVPSKEHLILNKRENTFGIDEMQLGKSFIIWQ